jgi:hypothetical protein
MTVEKKAMRQLAMKSQSTCCLGNRPMDGSIKKYKCDERHVHVRARVSENCEIRSFSFLHVALHASLPALIFFFSPTTRPTDRRKKRALFIRPLRLIKEV